MGKKISRRAKIGLGIGLGVLIMAILLVISVVLFQDREEYIVTESQNATITAVVCKASDPMDGFFAVEADGAKPQNATSTIKATYQNDSLDKLFYTYDGAYDLPETASQFEANAHANYNQYLGKNASDLAPKFAVNDKEVKITLFGDWDQLTAGMVKVFGLNAEDYTALGNDSSIEALAKIFQSKGYFCEVEK